MVGFGGLVLQNYDVYIVCHFLQQSFVFVFLLAGVLTLSFGPIYMVMMQKEKYEIVLHKRERVKKNESLNVFCAVVSGFAQFSNLVLRDFVSVYRLI